MSEQLLYEKVSAFEHDHWDREQWLALMNYSPTIRNMHERHLQNYGVSFAQDSYYALRNNVPKKDSSLCKFWTKVQGSSNFQSLPPFIQDLPSTATTVETLAGMIEQKIKDVYGDKAKDAPIEHNGQSFSVSVSDNQLDLEDKIESLIQIDACIGTLLDGYSPTEKRQEIEKIHNQFDLKKFSKLLGWAKSVIGSESRKGKSTSGELTGYGSGGWSGNVHPVDMLRVAQGEKQTMIRLAENQLNERRFSALRPKGQGPIVHLKDMSSSMRETSYWGASRIQTANSLELALATEFQKANRDLVSIGWSSMYTEQYTFGETGLSDYVSLSPRGDTRIERALSMAVKAASEYVDFADILITSDGFLHHNAALSVAEQKAEYDRLLKPFRDSGGRVYAILLIPGANVNYVADNWGWVDGWITVDALDDTASMTDILAKISRPRGNQKAKRLV
jgi:hypothetical protein